MEIYSLGIAWTATVFVSIVIAMWTHTITLRVIAWIDDQEKMVPPFWAGWVDTDKEFASWFFPLILLMGGLLAAAVWPLLIVVIPAIGFAFGARAVRRLQKKVAKILEPTRTEEAAAFYPSEFREARK